MWLIGLGDFSKRINPDSSINNLIDTTEGLWRKRKTYKLYSGSFNIETNPKYSETGELSQYMKYILKFQFNKRNIELYLSENLYSMIKEYEYFGNSKAS
ncbi:hypothetical protein CMT90_11770 [Elizabethkingia anophelis]|nr:hypothetical protein [Elizabethkingia anophelis]